MPWYFLWGMTVVIAGIPILVAGVLWFFVKIGFIFKGKCTVKEFCVQLALLSLTFFVAIPLAHLENEFAEQRQLKSLKEKFEQYRNQHGIVPASLEDAGISSDRRLRYDLKQNKAPRLTYDSYSSCLCLYVYDFKNHAWFIKGYNFGSVSESEYWNDFEKAK